MNKELTITQKIKDMLYLPSSGGLKSYNKYYEAANVLGQGVSQDELLAAFKKNDQYLLDYFKISFFYEWDSATDPELNLETSPRTIERREELYKVLNLNDDIKKLFTDHIPIAQSNDDIMIDNGEQTPSWLDEDNWFYWNKYKNYLINKYGEDAGLDIVRSIDDSSSKILNILQDPTIDKTSPRKGLVVGYVQSGKTSNMQALVAKAIDSGYKLIILLSGDKNILRNQTQRRFDKEIFGKEQIMKTPDEDIDSSTFIRDPKDEYYSSEDWDEFVSYGGAPRKIANRPNIYRLTTSKKSIGDGTFDQIFFKQGDSRFNTKENLRENDAYVAIITKNGPQIDKVIQQINIADFRGTHINQVPAIVIDDESDSASVGTQKPGAERKRVNQAIINLLKKLPKAQYVGYTATPYANVFIDYEDEEDLFPKNFINILDRPSNYMGASDFLIEDEDDYNPYVMAFTSEEEDEKLLEALDAYILSGAIKLYREKVLKFAKFDHHTMLVHTSTKTQDHDDLIEKIEKLLKEKCDYSGRAGKNRLELLYKNDYGPKLEDFDYVPFKELVPFIDETNSKITDVSGKPRSAILKVNGTRDGEDPDFSSGDCWKILVGGAKLSRGYTVEGLTVSFFTRATSANDTLMQMGRWFGFRKNYKDLVRLYITRTGGTTGRRDLFLDFMGACKMEEDFRKNIKIHLNKTADEIVKTNMTPLSFKRFVRHTLGLPATSAGKRQFQTVENENWGGMSREIWWYPKINETERLNNNLKVGQDLFNKYPLLPLKEDLKLDSSDIGKNVAHGLITGYKALISEPKDFIEFLKNYQWQEGKDYINSSVINFLESKFISKETDEIDINIDQWQIFFPQYSPSNKRDTLEFCGLDLDVFHRKRDMHKDHKSYGATSGGDVHTLITEWLAVGHENSEAKSFMGYPNDALKDCQKPKTSYALFYLMKDYDNKKDSIPTLGMHLRFNNNLMDRGSYFARDDNIQITDQNGPTFIS